MSPNSNYTEQQLRKVWMKPGYKVFLRPALAKLYELGTSDMYLVEWSDIIFKAAYVICTGKELPPEPGDPVDGLTTFLDGCLVNGLIEALLRIIRDSKAKFVRFNVMLSWNFLLKAADRHQKIIEAHANSEIQRLCKEVLMQSFQSNLSVERLRAVSCLRYWAAMCWSKNVKNREIATMISLCLAYAVGDHEDIVKDAKNKHTAWQLNFLTPESSESCSIEDIPRIWSVTRDEVLEAAIQLLSSREIARQRQDCLEIIQHAPDIFDQLLIIIGHFDRPAYYQEAESDATACLILAFLLSAPYSWLPEFSENSFCSSDSQFPLTKPPDRNVLFAEWKASLEIMKLFVRESKWKASLLRKWNKTEQESFKDILGKLQKAQKERKLVASIGTILEHVYEKRGHCRASILRILINLVSTDVSDVPLLPTNTLFSFLTLAYTACGKVPSFARAARSQQHPETTIGKLDYLLQKEKLSYVLRQKPQETIDVPTIASIYIPPENVLGPVLLLRLLRRINATYGKDIISWTSLPQNTLPNDHLGRCQQIASEEVLNIIIQNSIWKRIPYHKTEGTDFVTTNMSEGGLDFQDIARQGFLSAAELALAVAVFFQAAGPVEAEWKDLIPAAQRDLVACLGNISLMSSKLDQYDLAWWYAKHALDCLEKVNVSQAKLIDWDLEKMRKKNQDRLAQAEQILLTRASGAS